MTPKIVIHTDVFLEHLTGSGSPSILRQAMNRFFCYATVFHAMHLFSLARTARESKAIEAAMAAMKIMGLNARRAETYGRLLASTGPSNMMNVAIAGLCLESRLPILTDRAGDFRGIRGMQIVPTGLVAKFENGGQILRAARRGVHSNALKRES